MQLSCGFIWHSSFSLSGIETRDFNHTLWSSLFSCGILIFLISTDSLWFSLLFLRLSLSLSFVVSEIILSSLVSPRSSWGIRRSWDSVERAGRLYCTALVSRDIPCDLRVL